jgi:hypothetical protein
MKIPEPYRNWYRAARKQGWTITRTSKQHLVWESPGGLRVISPATPSDTHHLNTRAALRRAGLAV